MMFHIHNSICLFDLSRKLQDSYSCISPVQKRSSKLCSIC